MTNLKNLRHCAGLLVCVLGLLSLFAGCRKDPGVITDGEPYISSHLRYMYLEPTTVALVDAPKNAEVLVDFGDGTVETTTGSNPVTHVYEGPGDNDHIDYKITVSWEDNILERTVRVYKLMALSEAMKQFKDPKYKKVWVMTHRAHTMDRTIPENSCAAVNAAYNAGAEIVECDTHLTADGVVVVCHNQTINATTTGSGDITQLTLSQIKSYNMTDRNGRETTEKMPTLEEYLKAARGKVYVNMDYSPRTASSAQVYQIVQKLDMLEQVFFYCNSEEKANECFSLNPNCQVYPWFSDYGVLSGHPGVYFVQASFNSTGVDPSVASGAILSVNMKSVTGTDGASAYKLDEDEVNTIFTKFPACRMIQTDTPAELITYLDKLGKR